MASIVTLVPSTQRTDFTSVPRELRDQIYKLTLNHAEPIGRRPILYEILCGDQHYDRTKAYALFSPKASTAKIAREALEYFYASNTFKILLVDGPNLNHLRHHDPEVEKGRVYIQELIVDMWDSLINRHPNLSGFLARFLDYTSLRRLTMNVADGQHFENGTISHEELRQGLKCIAASCEGCEGLTSNLGDGLQFDINVLYIRAGSAYQGGSRLVDLRTLVLKCGLDRLKQAVDDLISFDGSP